MEKTTSYKCPGCGGAISFDVKTGKVKCPFCSNIFTVEEVKAFAGKDKNEKKDQKNIGFNWGNYKENLHFETMEGTVVYNCVSCGASVETDATTMATKCPYCDNNMIVDEAAKGGLRPNKIIPFKITSDSLYDTVNRFYQKKRLLPRNFFQKSKIKEIKGVYVPFWLFDAGINGDVLFEGTKTRHYRDGDYSVTEVSYYDIDRGGSMQFERIPVDASIKMDNALMDSLEPFDYSELVDFDPAYLTGYLADRFDSEPEAELDRAGKRMANSAAEVYRDTVSGYDSVKLASTMLTLAKPAVTYAMLPVYLINNEYKGKIYHYGVNGQTGKIVGELPMDKKKLKRNGRLAFLVGLAASLIIGALIQLI